jgi:cytochrome c biogenesis protein CcmG/thiol:disulfide interchange protein DsbE
VDSSTRQPPADPPVTAGGEPRRRRVRLVPALSLGLTALLLGALAWNLTRPAPAPVDSFVVSGAPQPSGPARFQQLPPGTPAPPLRLAAVGGGTVDLAALRGRPVVVNFWAVWCEPCKREFPLLRAAYAEHRAAGLEIVGVAVRTDEASARDYAKVSGASWPMVLDHGDRAAAAWRAGLLPQTFFVRPDGTIASHQVGELGRATLDQQLGAILPAG